ncbi:MAG: BBP7 family outer membrane beta-barrel protein [Planctomycetota bacterium]|nr:BBP7 family outer membrane beta-barrel protein [Planctomycetota bacterium]
MTKILSQAVWVGLFVFASTGVAQYNFNFVPSQNSYPEYSVPSRYPLYPGSLNQPPQRSAGYSSGMQLQRLPGNVQPPYRVGNGYQGQAPYTASRTPFGAQSTTQSGGSGSPSPLPAPAVNSRQSSDNVAPLVDMPPVQQPAGPGATVGNGVPQLPLQPSVHGLQQQVQPVPAHSLMNYPALMPGRNPWIGPVGAGCQQPVCGPAFGHGCGQKRCCLGGGIFALGKGIHAHQGICGQGGCAIVPPAIARQGCWYGGLGGLIFQRDLEDDKFFAYPLGQPMVKSLSSADADPGTMGGLEASFGKRFCNGTGFGVVYWGLFSELATASVTTGNPQTTWQTAPSITYNGSGLDTYLNSAAAYMVSRENEFHNVELNFLRRTLAATDNNCQPCCETGCGPGRCRYWPGLIRSQSPFRFDVLAGIRFFKFDENLFFRTSMTGDYSSNVNDVCYNLDVDNRLLGLQLGGMVEYCLCPRWTVNGGTKFGVFGNSISHRQQLYGLAGYAWANNGGYTGQDYDLQASKTDVAFLGEADLGVKYSINCNWNVGIGYRVVAVTGVALAPEQIPHNFADYHDAVHLDSNSGLILYGSYLRVQYNF